MAGKRGLVLGVANNRSIAWGIAKSCRREGAELALTYQGEALQRRVEPLAAEIGATVVGHCDVTDTASVDAVFAAVEALWGGFDFLVHAVAYSDREQLTGRYLDTTAENFATTLLISCYSLTALAQRAEKLMQNGGSILTLTYYGAEKVMPHYNVMGVAKAALEASVRYLAVDLGKQGIRINALSAGPIKTLAAAGGIGDFRYILKWNELNAPLRPHRHHRRCRRCGALPPVGSFSRGHRRGPPRRLRLPRGRDEVGRRAGYRDGEGLTPRTRRAFRWHRPSRPSPSFVTARPIGTWRVASRGSATCR